MKSTILSCLLTLGSKSCVLCCLLVCSGHRCENLVRKSISSVRFVNMLRIAHKHPPRLLQALPFCIYCILFFANRRFGSWSMDFITGLPSYANSCNAIFTCVNCLTNYIVLTPCTLGMGELSAK